VSKPSNTRYLWKLWLKPLIWIVVAGAFVWRAIAAGAVDGSYLVPVFVLLVVLGTVAFGLQRARGLGKEMRLALTAPTAAPMLDVIDRSFKGARVSDADAYLAQSRANALALFGDASGARAALSAVDWQRRAPMIQAAGVAAESLVMLLCDGDATDGLAEARRAQALAELPAAPGAASSDRYFATVVALGQTLTNEPDASTVPALERARATKHLPTLQAMALAGLAAYAQHRGTPDEAATAQSELAAYAPKLAALLFARYFEDPAARS
jgi:hypothetical protein